MSRGLDHYPVLPSDPNEPFPGIILIRIQMSLSLEERSWYPPATSDKLTLKYFLY